MISNVSLRTDICTLQSALLRIAAALEAKSATRGLSPGLQKELAGLAKLARNAVGVSNEWAEDNELEVLVAQQSSTTPVVQNTKPCGCGK